MTEQLPREAIGKLSPRALLVASRAGELDDVLAGITGAGGDDEPSSAAPRSPRPNPAQGSNGSREPEKPPGNVAQLRRLTPEAINRLRRQGALDGLMGRKRPR